MTSRSRIVDADGLRLHVELHPGPTGAPPVLLMHGGMAHAQWWVPLARRLRESLDVYALDRRGHGGSDWATIERYGWRIDLDDAERVAAELAPGPWLLVGHSQGGLLSVHLALRGRIPLRGLVVLDSPFEPRTPALRRAGEGFRRVPQIRYPSLEHAIERFQPYPPHHRVPEDVLREIAIASFKPVPDGGWVSRFHWARFRATDGPPHPLEGFAGDLEKIVVPTLVVRGEESTILSASDHAAFVACLPDGRGVEIPGATHSLHVERPDAVADAIVAFARGL